MHLSQLTRNLKKNHKPEKLSFFVDAESILWREWPRKKEKQKRKNDVLIEKDFWTMHLAPPISKTIKPVDFKISGSKQYANI